MGGRLLVDINGGSVSYGLGWNIDPRTTLRRDEWTNCGVIYRPWMRWPSWYHRCWKARDTTVRLKQHKLDAAAELPSLESSCRSELADNDRSRPDDLRLSSLYDRYSSVTIGTPATENDKKVETVSINNKQSPLFRLQRNTGAIEVRLFICRTKIGNITSCEKAKK